MIEFGHEGKRDISTEKKKKREGTWFFEKNGDCRREEIVKKEKK